MHKHILSSSMATLHKCSMLWAYHKDVSIVQVTSELYLQIAKTVVKLSQNEMHQLRCRQLCYFFCQSRDKEKPLQLLPCLPNSSLFLTVLSVCVQLHLLINCFIILSIRFFFPTYIFFKACSLKAFSYMTLPFLYEQLQRSVIQSLDYHHTGTALLTQSQQLSHNYCMLVYSPIIQMFVF